RPPGLPRHADRTLAAIHVRPGRGAHLTLMPRRRAASRTRTTADRVLEPPQETILDVLDHLLAKGVMATGDVTLGVAGIDLIYLRLSTLLCAADRVLPHGAPTPRRTRVRRRRAVRRSSS